MEHVVFYPGPEGTPAFRRVAGLEEAVRLVEHLRNVEGVGEVAVHLLGEEVPLAFRTWYRVEVPAAGVLAEPAAEPAVAELPAAELPGAELPGAELPGDLPVEVPAQAAPAAEPVPALDEAAFPAVEAAHDDAAPAEPAGPATEPAGEPAAASNGAGDGLRSLGFFAT